MGNEPLREGRGQFDLAQPSYRQEWMRRQREEREERRKERTLVHPNNATHAKEEKR